MDKLDNRKMRLIVENWKYKGKSLSWLAEQYGVTRQRISQIIGYYKKNGCPPTLKKRGRKKKEIPYSEIQHVLFYAETTCLGAVGLEKCIELETGEHIPHNRIHKILTENHLASPNPKKQKQRKYCRYERKHSMSLWHGDWSLFRLHDKAYWLIAFIDDSSRLITCYGVYEHATAANSVEVLKKGFNEYGIPDAIVTDNGTQFVPLNSNDPESHEFVGFLKKNGVQQIRSHPSHPQTNGKIERTFEEVNRRMGTQFETIDEFVVWQNTVKPHRGLNYKRPIDVFYNRLRPERVFFAVGGWFFNDSTKA